MPTPKIPPPPSLEDSLTFLPELLFTGAVADGGNLPNQHYFPCARGSSSAHSKRKPPNHLTSRRFKRNLKRGFQTVFQETHRNWPRHSQWTEVLLKSTSSTILLQTMVSPTSRSRTPAAFECIRHPCSFWKPIGLQRYTALEHEGFI